MNWKTGLKWLLTLLAVAWLYFTQDWLAVIAQFKNADWLLLCWAMLLSFLMIPMHALRWHAMMAIHREPIAFSQILRYTCLGFFSNLFLPSSIGGDAVKSVALGRATGSLASSLATTIVARFFGLVILYVFFWVMLVLNPSLQELLVLEIPVMAVLGILGLILFCLPLLIKPKISRDENKVFKKLLALTGAFRQIIKNKEVLFKSLVWSLGIQAANLAFSYLAFRSFSAEIQVGGFFLAMPLLIILAMVPITIFNIGVRESLAIYFLGRLAGLDASVCIAGSSVGYLAALSQAVPGAWFMLKSKSGSR